MLSKPNSKRWQSIGVLMLVSALGAIGLRACWPKLAEPLCKLETFAGTYSLQTLGYPGQRIIRRGIRVGLALRCKQLWMGHHSIETSTLEQRQRFLAKVEQRFATVK